MNRRSAVTILLIVTAIGAAVVGLVSEDYDLIIAGLLIMALAGLDILMNGQKTLLERSHKIMSELEDLKKERQGD